MCELKLVDLNEPDFFRALSADGVGIQVGRLAIRVRSSIKSVGRGLRLLYGDYPLLDDNDFVDFNVSLERPNNLRRWFHPQVDFSYDGMSPFKPLPLDHAFPMFEWGFNWCVVNAMHNHLIIHAAVVEKNGRAVIMPAPPGSGKSTLCAALVSKGWRLLSDELAMIALADGYLTPLPRPVGLKNNSIDIIRSFSPDMEFGPVVKDTHKGTVAHMKATDESISRARDVAQAAWIIFPRYIEHFDTSLVPLSKAQTLMQVASNSFNYSVLGESGFRALESLVDRCGCYSFSYSRLEEAIAAFDGLKV